MKFCRLLYYVIIVQFMNSCLANSVTKTEAPPTNTGNTIDDAYSNNTEDPGAETDPPITKKTTVIVEGLPPDAFKDGTAEISENVGQASQIQSSFEDIQKSKVDEVAVNENLPGVLNQGTLSQDVSESGTLGVVSLADSASADLHQLASSASADVATDGKSDKVTSTNTTTGSLPPILILPPSDTDQAQPKDQPRDKTDFTMSDVKPPDSPQPPVVRAEPKVVESVAILDDKPDQVISGTVVKHESHSTEQSSQPQEPVSPPAPTTGSPLDLVGVPQIPQEEIPSFSEWTQKQLEEAEKKKGQNKTASPSLSRGPAPSKMRSKNYASPDCGAKIVAANPEAEYPNGVLSNSKDEYLINKCSTQRMWLIIELCEAVQAKKIELANFELFSSSPKDFSVFLSHNHPSREWASVGQFTAKDERNVQSFNLQPHLFGKFLKVEFNSHYGKEHFCCTSLIRVYGTSEFEVLETENEVHSAGNDLDDEDEDEQPIGVDMGKPAKNLFGHATDAVFTIVRKAAEVLVKSGDSQNQSQTLETKNSTALIPSFRRGPQHCNTLRHLVVCNNCSEEFFDQVYHLLSCRSTDLQALIESPFVFDGINNSQLCSLYGLDIISRRDVGAPLRLRHEDQLDQAGYLAAMLPAEYISALCNILAVLEGKVVLNTSQAAREYRSINLNTEPSPDTDVKNLLIEHQPLQTCSVDASFTLSHCQPLSSGTNSLHTSDVSTSVAGSQPGPSTHSSIASEIKPTRTLSKEEAKEISVSEGSAPQIPVQKSGTVPDVMATFSSPSHVNVEPSVVLVSINVPIDVAPEAVQETLTPDQPVLEVPPHDKDLSDSSFGLDATTPEDQEPSKDLDALIMEMKALDNNEESSTESGPSLGGAASTASSVVTHTRVPTQQAQKESVFLRLSNKIKALERNMSLSGQYLEELSRRYKKQEELSRALNKTLGLLREEVKKSKDREQQRDSDLLFLRTQLIHLTTTLESYQSERDSWQHKAVVISQHFVLIVIEVVMFGIVVWMCRRFPTDGGVISSTGPQRKWSTGWRKINKSQVKHLRRRSSLDGLSNSQSDLKKRRPSEEALKITGSYKDLLLQEDNVIFVEGEDITPQAIEPSSWLSVASSKEQRRKKKRRKEGLVKSSSSHNLAQLQVDKSVTRKISAPLHSFSLDCENNDSDAARKLTEVPAKSGTAEGIGADTSISETSPVPISFPATEGNSEYHDAFQISSAFMGTATSMRNQRPSNMPEAQLLFHAPAWNHHEGDSGSTASGQSSRSKGLDSLEPVYNSSRSDNQGSILTEKKKVNKKGGLKNMVKKFF